MRLVARVQKFIPKVHYGNSFIIYFVLHQYLLSHFLVFFDQIIKYYLCSDI